MLPSRSSRGRSRRAGVATVELALVAPVLCFLFVVATDFARIFYYAVTVQNCARNGAYYAADYPNNSYLYNDIYGYKSIDDAILSDASNLYDASTPELKPTYTVRYDTSLSGSFSLTSPPSSAGYAQVTVNWTFTTLTRYPGVPNSIPLSRTVTMQIAPAMPTFP